MKVVPPEVVDTLRRSHTTVTRADVRLGGVDLITDAPVETGNVRLDGTSLVRGSVDMTIAGGAEFVPDRPQAGLAPFGQEVWLRMGVRLGTGEIFDWPMGVYPIDTMDATDDGDIRLTISGRDRTGRLDDARTLDVWNVAAGTNFGQAITSLVQAYAPGLPVQVEPTYAVTPQIVWPENTNVLEAVTDMAAAFGMEVFADGNGVLVVRTVIRPAPSPAALITEAIVVEDNLGTLTSIEKNWSRLQNPNNVVVTGTNTSVAPCRGSAADLDPLSPTYFYGPYGQVTLFIDSDLVVDNAQCTVMAQAELARRVGVTEALTLSSVPDPRLEPGDTVYVSRLRIGVSQLAVLDQVTIPLAPDGTMQTITRTRQVTS